MDSIIEVPKDVLGLICGMLRARDIAALRVICGPMRRRFDRCFAGPRYTRRRLLDNERNGYVCMTLDVIYKGWPIMNRMWPLWVKTHMDDMLNKYSYLRVVETTCGRDTIIRLWCRTAQFDYHIYSRDMVYRCMVTRCLGSDAWSIITVVLVTQGVSLEEVIKAYWQFNYNGQQSLLTEDNLLLDRMRGKYLRYNLWPDFMYSEAARDILMGPE